MTTTILDILRTVATAGTVDRQPIVRPDSGLPWASLRVAVSCWVRPTSRTRSAWLSSTRATPARTVIAEEPVFPSTVAVTVAVPVVTAVTSPSAETVATADVADVQVTVRPVIGWPFWSRTVALSRMVSSGASEAVPGATATEVTTGVGGGGGGGGGVTTLSPPQASNATMATGRSCRVEAGWRTMVGTGGSEGP